MSNGTLSQQLQQKQATSPYLSRTQRIQASSDFEANRRTYDSVKEKVSQMSAEDYEKFYPSIPSSVKSYFLIPSSVKSQINEQKEKYITQGKEKIQTEIAKISERLSRLKRMYRDKKRKDLKPTINLLEDRIDFLKKEAILNVEKGYTFESSISNAIEKANNIYDRKQRIAEKKLISQNEIGGYVFVEGKAPNNYTAIPLSKGVVDSEAYKQYSKASSSSFSESALRSRDYQIKKGQITSTRVYPLATITELYEGTKTKKLIEKPVVFGSQGVADFLNTNYDLYSSQEASYQENQRLRSFGKTFGKITESEARAKYPRLYLEFQDKAGKGTETANQLIAEGRSETEVAKWLSPSKPSGILSGIPLVRTFTPSYRENVKREYGLIKEEYNLLYPEEASAKQLTTNSRLKTLTYRDIDSGKAVMNLSGLSAFGVIAKKGAVRFGRETLDFANMIATPVSMSYNPKLLFISSERKKEKETYIKFANKLESYAGELSYYTTIGKKIPKEKYKERWRDSVYSGQAVSDYLSTTIIAKSLGSFGDDLLQAGVKNYQQFGLKGFKRKNIFKDKNIYQISDDLIEPAIPKTTTIIDKADDFIKGRSVPKTSMKRVVSGKTIKPAYSVQKYSVFNVNTGQREIRQGFSVAEAKLFSEGTGGTIGVRKSLVPSYKKGKIVNVLKTDVVSSQISLSPSYRYPEPWTAKEQLKMSDVIPQTKKITLQDTFMTKSASKTIGVRGVRTKASIMENPLSWELKSYADGGILKAYSKLGGASTKTTFAQPSITQASSLELARMKTLRSGSFKTTGKLSMVEGQSYLDVYSFMPSAKAKISYAPKSRAIAGKKQERILFEGFVRELKTKSAGKPAPIKVDEVFNIDFSSFDEALGFKPKTKKVLGKNTQSIAVSKTKGKEATISKELMKEIVAEGQKGGLALTQSVQDVSAIPTIKTATKTSSATSFKLGSAGLVLPKSMQSQKSRIISREKLNEKDLFRTDEFRGSKDMLKQEDMLKQAQIIKQGSKTSQMQKAKSLTKSLAKSGVAQIGKTTSTFPKTPRVPKAPIIPIVPFIDIELEKLKFKKMKARKLKIKQGKSSYRPSVISALTGSTATMSSKQFKNLEKRVFSGFEVRPLIRIRN